MTDASADILLERNADLVLTVDNGITAAKEMNRDSLETNGLLDRSFVAKRDPSTLINWGDNERKELRGVAQGIWAEWGKKSPMAKRLLDSHMAFMKRIGLI